jgi:hypothetical protein
MGVDSVCSGVVAFIAAGIQVKSIHVLRRLLDLGYFLGVGNHKDVFACWARTQEQRGSGEHHWVTDPALSPLFR